jgi:hypothetical protein
LLFRRGQLVVAANVSPQALSVPFARQATLLLASHGVALAPPSLRLPAWGVGILRTLG